METTILLTNPFTTPSSQKSATMVRFSPSALAKCLRRLRNLPSNLKRISQLRVDADALSRLQKASLDFGGAAAFGPAEVHLVTTNGRYTSLRLDLECIGHDVVISTPPEALLNLS